MKRLVLSISLCAVALSVSAQWKINETLPRLSQSDVTIVEKNSDGSIKSVRYAATDSNIPATANEFFTGTLKKRPADDFVMDRSCKSDNGMSYERYQQYYRGVIVADGHYNFRIQNGRMKGVKGHYVNVSIIDPVPSITENEAKNLYASHFGIGSKDVFRSYIDLMIKEIPDADRKESIAALVYRVFLLVLNAEDKYVGYIDAHTGKLLYKENASVDYNTTGYFYTYYNRNYNDIPKFGNTDYSSLNNIYSLNDNSRWDGIYTKKIENSSAVDFTDNDNEWTRNEMGAYNMALDVHWTMEKIYDYMFNAFVCPSFDGNYHQIESFISNNSLAQFVYPANIFYFGYASGSSVYGPLASVDKIGHEYGHAILFNKTSFDKSPSPKNAIHEGLADIWGIIFEKQITPSANYWKSGEQLMINGYSCERNFQSPNDVTAYTQIASTYGCGAFYSTDSHIVGGLLPYWFYLLVNGGSGTNGNNYSYQLLPVGFDLAKQLFTKATLDPFYLQDCDSFQDVANAFIDAADDMPNSSFLVEQVINSLYAVGLYSEPQHIYMQSSNTYYVIGNSSCVVNWSFTSSYGPIPTLVPNSSNYSCTLSASSNFGGYLNATIYCGGCTVTYSRYIVGGASPSSAGDDVLQIIPLDGTHYQLSVGGEYGSGSLKVYDAASLQVKTKENLVNESYMLDTSSWKRGLYIVELTIGNKTYTTKITKK